MPRVLIVGVSTRAAAESAVRAGYDVVALDAYGDLDHPSDCHTLSRDVRWSAAAAARHARSLDADAVAYLSNIDNDPRAVAALAAERALWGNTPETLQHARDPLAVRDAFRAAGIDAPDALVGGNVSPGGRWLLKPLRSGGGTRVRRWRGIEVPRSHYAQTFIEGTSGSVVFVAAGGHAVVLGTALQLVGDAAFGASGFRYCGSLLCGAADPSMRAQADAIAGVAASAFGLVGVGGVDFVDDGRVMHPIEVNPRWTASMELVERARGVSVFAAHVAACTTGALPVGLMPSAGAVHGKAIVFARHRVTLGDTRSWLDDPMVRDITRPGAVVRTSQPVCTVLAQGADPAACYQALVKRAEAVYAQLAHWAKAAA
jgi:uncharacterized protein